MTSPWPKCYACTGSASIKYRLYVSKPKDQRGPRTVYVCAGTAHREEALKDAKILSTEYLTDAYATRKVT
jgi:hypothetical protein